MGNWWFAAGGTAKVVPPEPVSRLVLPGLYGSWLLNEGGGVVAAAENAPGRELALTTDSGNAAGIPTWIPGGGVRTVGGTSQLRRASEAALNGVGGVTLTLAFRPVANTGARSYMQRSSGNLGYNFQLNASGTAINASLGTGSARTTTRLGTYALNSLYVMCVTLPNDGGEISVNSSGVLSKPTPAVINWQAAVNAALIVGYTTTADFHYVALHTRVLTSQEQSDMVAYAISVLASRGLA